ncbi:H-34,SpoIID/LytB domain,Stage II sporulation protein [Chlamydia serpentis]|uniref:H-34,SpoIID/LytB domain,Stage II sporulation protein n=1 Tax=Chlamydia serpentis TaxID=1967782 RepID=A0A2R8FB56_9CHLA|nr:SpoIID/LytB domain-containing protein [Chlamydia serpentis]SPN73526.1 H-34,SpoIID/LytB domain,Stage II sporulation protein [Chlamydia serpentis]
MKILQYVLLGLFFSTSISGTSEVKVSDTFIKQATVVEPKIRILLANESTTALIEAKGPYRIYGDNVLLDTAIQGQRCVVHALYEGIRWGEFYPGLQCLKIEPIDESASLFFNGIQYQGALYVHRKDNHCIMVSNEVAIEDYLKSVLSIKYLKELDKEALSACVILERTALYERLLARNPQNFWHLKADEENYAGFGVTKQFYGIEEAVDWTARLVVDSPQGLMLDAQGLLQSNVDRLAIEGLNARQILEKFYKDIDFVVIESWNEELDSDIR